MPEQHSLKYFVKRIAFNEYEQIAEIEFFDTVPYTPEEIAAFVRQYDTRLKMRGNPQPELVK